MTDMPSAWVSEIEFSGGDKITLGKRDKIILVGPNNAGKSQCLREIVACCQSAAGRNKVVSSLQMEKEGSVENLKNFLLENADYVDSQFRYKNWQIHENHLAQFNQTNLPNQLVGGFVKNIDAKSRLSICDRKNSVSPGDHRSEPQQVLYDDEQLMNKVSSLFRKAFNEDLMFDYRGGSKLPIHVGVLSELTHISNQVSNEYVEKVRANPLLEDQGDGMKSYAGILFEAIVADVDVTLIDEPEAFLHPPQMRKLGETLSSEVRGQLIVATHSSDILRGFLEGTQGGIRILRISREGNTNRVSEASIDVIKELWEKPNLRYSNALDGIFHEQTILCEDDSDCRLYNSCADYIASNAEDPWKDTAYIPSGGKSGIPKIAGALRGVGVPVKAIFDIDFLSDKDFVRRCVESFGGSWSEVDSLWQRLDAAVRNGITAKSPDEIREEIVQELEATQGSDIPRSSITGIMKQGKEWNEVKRFGTSAIPNGDAQVYFQSLKEALVRIGIYLVPVGEPENFCQEIGGHGPKFVSQLLLSISLGDEKVRDLREFVKAVHVST